MKKLNERRRLGETLVVLFLAIVSHASATLYQVGPTETYPDLFSVAPLLAPGDVVQVDGNVTYAGGVVFQTTGRRETPSRSRESR